MKEIAIITGGNSAEYEISLSSANVVLNNLNKKKYKGTIINIKKNNWVAEVEGNKIEINKEDFSVTNKGYKTCFDFVFMALHGPPAENGELQTYFDNLNLPYSSCNSKVSALTFNKIECNKLLTEFGFICANSFSYKKGEDIIPEKIIEKVGLPCFVKPNQAGSSFGISKVKKENEIEKAIEKALEHDNEVLIEQFIDGIELSCGVIWNNNKVKALPITEIVSKNEFFDFEAKYQGLSEEITPARINSELSTNIQKTTEEVYKKMNLRGICRIDFIVMNNIPYIIEINTIPGLSEESILPKQAKEAGFSLSELFDICIENTINK